MRALGTGTCIFTFALFLFLSLSLYVFSVFFLSLSLCPFLSLSLSLFRTPSRVTHKEPSVLLFFLLRLLRRGRHLLKPSLSPSNTLSLSQTHQPQLQGWRRRRRRQQRRRRSGARRWRESRRRPRSHSICPSISISSSSSFR